MTVFWTPLDLVISLLGRAAASPAAQKAGRENLVSTLASLHAGLLELPEDPHAVGAGAAQFSNAASDLFCHQRVSELGQRGGLDRLSGQVEAALHALKNGGLMARERNDLLLLLESTINLLR